MKQKRMLYLAGITMLGLLTLWGCPKKTEVTASPEAQTQNETKKAPATAPTGTAAATETRAASATTAGLTPIYFDFDKSVIRPDAKTTLRKNAHWLKAHPAVKIRIAGNCDERGTVAYNQALGERRAKSAKQYLAALGVAPSRIALISYGKEKPICTEHAETCWQKNRRDDFVAR